MAAATSEALFSSCGRYRYRLSRRWNAARPLAAFVMLNPSTADAVADDPTIRCCIRLAEREGFGGIRVVNLFAYRTPDRTLLATVSDPVGPDNDRHIRAAVRSATVCILAWGAYVPDSDRVQTVLRLLRRTRITLKCIEMIGPAGNRQPRHPLYLRSTATLVDFP
jgi:hypothetical protein